MKHFACVVLLSVLVLTGCASILNVPYQPNSPTVYTEKFALRASVRTVSDERNLDPAQYWVNPDTKLDRAKYDRPVAEIVREALQAEFQRAGLNPPSGQGTAESKASIALNCQVTDFKALFSSKLFGSNSVELVVSLRFQWIDPNNGTLLEENERAERRLLDLGFGNEPTLPFEVGQIKGYGTQLVNDLLPRAIEKEIRLNKQLRAGT